MKIITSGESHGKYITATVEGFPKGVHVSHDRINRELKRRMQGYGRGARMHLETDSVEIVSGMRNCVTLGSPITMIVANRDHRIFTCGKDDQPALSVPRPAHADLAGAMKYNETDVRNILERSSARETVARVCLGALCKQLLLHFDVRIASFVVSIADVASKIKPKNIAEIERRGTTSLLGCIDAAAEKKMIQKIDQARVHGDSVGGVAEVWIEGVCPGIGSFMHFEKRLDALLAGHLMSIPAVKGVEIGLGFEYAKSLGSRAHDQIFYDTKKGFFHKTDNSGGIEGGISNGEVIVARFAMKPIATLTRPLVSVDLVTKKKAKAIIERSDVCALPACAVVAESMSAIALTGAYLDKFGSDTLKEIVRSYKAFRIESRRLR